MRSVQNALAELTDLETIFRTLHTELGRVMDATGFILGLHEVGGSMVEIVGQMEGGVELPGGSFPLGEGFLSQVIRNRQPFHIGHWSVEGPRVQVQYATGTPGLPESTVTVPLLVGGRAIGVLSLQSYAVDAYDDDDLFLLQALAAQIAPVIEVLQRGKAVRAVRRVSKLEAVLSSMTDGLLILDADGRITSLNPPARSIFGSLGAGIILGQPLDRELRGQWPLGAKVVADALGPMLEALQRGKAQRDVEVEVNAQGRRVLSFSSAPLSDVSGALAGGVVVIHDVTTQRDVARLRDELLSIASHDLRTPATVLKVQAQMMQRDLQRNDVDAAKLSGRVDMILEQTDRLTRMLNMLLDLSRVEAGRLDLSPEPVDLADLIRRSVAAVRALSSKHTIEVRAPRRMRGLWDAARLEQVMQNLLTNAIKYAPNGGTIVVSLECRGPELTVSVRDEGLGIAREELAQLFERFYRVARTRGLEGSGLGLYVCQAIVAAHGGRIWATSEGPGRGTTVSFTLPSERRLHQAA
jgi:signal transduction histidine kinase